MGGQVVVGMAGWVFPGWRDGFYPKGITQKTELEFASRHVTSIELNGSFYSLQKPASWSSWRDRTPDAFVFSVKAPKFITHVRRLDDVAEPLANFFASGLLMLGAKLGSVLWQLPPSFEFEPYIVEKFLEMLPHTTGAAVELARQRSERMTGREHLETDAERPVRHALEVRHPSFSDPAFVDLLKKYRVAVVYGDGASWPVIDADTAGFRYARLHADEKLYPGGYYEPADIDRWATQIETWSAAGLDCYIYFDDATKTRAPIDAMSLLARLGAKP